MASDPKELECWPLADRLRREVHAICAKSNVSRHYRFCDGFTEAAGSVCRNISEGFGRGSPAAIVQFFDYALGSLAEVDDYLHECVTRRFLDRAGFEELHELKEHARATTRKFKAHHERKLSRSRRTKSQRHEPREFIYVAPDKTDQ